MSAILGIDTSNYTTSVALIDSESGKLIASRKQLLPVKEGERGIRQSDAVFHHTAALPQLLGQLYKEFDGETLAVCVSEKPSEQQGSYMPCFLAGVNAATAIAGAAHIPLFQTSHQIGHVTACLYGAEKTEYTQKPFLCFHISGGTTDALAVTPDTENIMSIERVAKSLDLKAGQAVDRIGVKMGLSFPAGAALDALAQKSTQHYRQKAAFKGSDCSLSGLENKALKMLEEGQPQEDVARFCFDYLANTFSEMSARLLEQYPDFPLFFAGGVMSNSIIKETLTKRFGAFFCPPEFAADNAVGIAYYGYLQWNNLKKQSLQYPN